MSASLTSSIDPLPYFNRPMRVESVARRYGIPSRTIRWAAERGLLKGFKRPDTPKLWRFWRRDVEDWVHRRQQCN
jgi:hypothetical protein